MQPAAGSVRFEVDEDGRHIWWSHDCVDGSTVGKRLRVDMMLPQGAEKCWTITQREPLTVRPSIDCGDCGLHGFITDGEWVPA